jgi:hypothetical protein
MIAKYPGTCKTCTGRIAPGAAIQMTARGAVHAHCFHVAVVTGSHRGRTHWGDDDGYDAARDAYLTGESNYNPRR